MDKKEMILRQLSTIALNNKITELNNVIEAQTEKSTDSYDKSKQLFTELIQSNKKLCAEKVDLTLELTSAQREIENLKLTVQHQQTILDKIPKFILKLILRNKNVKLLN